MNSEIQKQGYDLFSLTEIFAQRVSRFALSNRVFNANRKLEQEKRVSICVVVLREVVVKAYTECQLMSTRRKFAKRYEKFIKYICEAGDKVYLGRMFTKCWRKASSICDLKELFLDGDKTSKSISLDHFWQSEIEFLRSMSSISEFVGEILADEKSLQTFSFMIQDFCFRVYTIIDPIKWDSFMTLPPKKRRLKIFKSQYDVFITYRREDGLNYAQLLFQALEKRGYKCYLDVRDVQDGEYEKRIMAALRGAPNYIFIMTEGALQRLSETGNSVYNEVNEALCLHKKVIPVAPSGVSRNLYGAKLLDDFNCLRALSVSRLETGEFFDESVNNIVKRFPVRASLFLRRILKALLVAALIVGIGVVVERNSKDNPVGDLDTKDKGSNNTDISVEPILKRMKEIRLPSISFKPPATIVDAVEYLRCVSRDYDRPDIPLGMRGFNIELKREKEEDSNLIPVIPLITATDISFYDALNLVCECVEYRFEIANGTIVVLPKDMALVELPTQWFDIDDDRLHETVSAWAAYDKERNDGFGFEQKDDDQESSFCNDVKGFLREHDVKWPPGSRLRYLSSTSQICITNCLEEIEKIRALLRKNQILIEAQQR